MSVIAKFKMESMVINGDDTRSLTLRAVVGYKPDGSRIDENESWSKWTPSGEIRMTISNPEAYEQFEPNANYFITFKKEQ